MAESERNARLEGFCDGVFAIALTLLIIDVAIPATVKINSTTEFWLALRNVAPSILVFALSFVVIFITWVNHHNNLKLVNKSSPAFVYANGFLILTVVFVPFPTSLLGEYLLTDYSSPAVVLYDTTIAAQALAWILLTGAALKYKLTRNDKSTLAMREANRNGYFALAGYSLCAIVAIWFPQTIAVVTALSWVFWLIYGINIKAEY
jgi:uncharacterized membrane protein